MSPITQFGGVNGSVCGPVDRLKQGGDKMSNLKIFFLAITLAACSPTSPENATTISADLSGRYISSSGEYIITLSGSSFDLKLLYGGSKDVQGFKASMDLSGSVDSIFTKSKPGTICADNLKLETCRDTTYRVRQIKLTISDVAKILGDGSLQKRELSALAGTRFQKHAADTAAPLEYGFEGEIYNNEINFSYGLDVVRQ